MPSISISISNSSKSGSVIVPVFSPRARAEYDLEGMHGEQDGSNVRSVPNPEEVESL